MGLLWKPYLAVRTIGQNPKSVHWQCCEMDDLKASSVVIWNTAVPHVDPLTVVSNDVESLAILGWNRPCSPTTILLMTIPTWGPYFRAARLIGDYGGWFRLGKSTSSNTFHRPFLEATLPPIVMVQWFKSTKYERKLILEIHHFQQKNNMINHPLTFGDWIFLGMGGEVPFPTDWAMTLDLRGRTGHQDFLRCMSCNDLRALAGCYGCNQGREGGHRSPKKHDTILVDWLVTLPVL